MQLEHPHEELILPAVAVLALVFVAADAEQADAVGFHFRAGGVHVDVGRPHGFHGRRVIRHGFHHGGGAFWHDTSHLDWHPGGFVPHGNHYDYIPGHWNVHRSGHWHFRHW